MSAGRRLSRATLGGAGARPVRIVHLGLGSFFRAHQAWYTDRAPDANEWGIAAFTGRRPALCDALTPQDGLYTLVTRGEEGDTFEVVRSLSCVHPAGDHARWLDHARSPALGIVSLTVTEAGYQRDAEGALDTSNPEVARDIDALREDLAAPVSTVPARLLAGLVTRHRAGLGQVAVMPCDNLPENGAMTQRLLRDLATLVDPRLMDVVDTTSFVTTMVDRITPGTTDDDRELVARQTGWWDAAPVTTEPFSEWVVSGHFPAGRPAWDRAGVIFTDDVGPFEQRKLWMLNGAHSLLAYAGSALGHSTVADAVADPVCRGWVEEWWDEAARHMSLPAEDVRRYRDALVERFRNPRIRHLLAQIAADGSQKIPVRILPVLRAERGDGRLPSGATRAVAAWICHLRGLGAPVNDRTGDACRAAAAGPVDDAARGVLGLLDPALSADEAVVRSLARSIEDLGAFRTPCARGGFR